MSDGYMSKEILHLWFAFPDDLLDEEAAQSCFRLLNEGERARWRALKFDRHRREYLATHALLRNALSQQRSLPPEAWRFVTNANGKPAIEPECGLRFNLSNSLDLVVCLLAEDSEVGVDVEPYARAGSTVEVGPRMFSRQELAQLENLCEDQRLGRCLRLWTLKEAYIKARGMGLALPTKKFSFIFEAEGKVRIEMDQGFDDDPSRWQFCFLDHAEHCVAMTVESKAPIELHVWESRPPTAVPRRLGLPNALWFSS